MVEPVCDFIPDECAAVAMQMCILLKICEIELIDWDSLNEKLEALFGDGQGGLGGLYAEAKLEIDVLSECIINTITSAAQANGCSPPPLPPTPEPPDFSECLAAIERIKSEVTNPVAFLAPYMTVTFDSQFLPLRITVP